MAKKMFAKEMLEQEDREQYKIEYTGSAAKTTVYGLGVFKKGKAVSFEDPQKMEQAKQLVESNKNFKEVKS